jgi:hypothetical protein
VASRVATPTVGIGAFRAPYTLPWPALLTLLLFGGFALTSGRGTAWWPFVAVFVVAPWLQPATARLPRPTPDGLRRINTGIAVGLVIVTIVLLPVWRPVGPGGVPSGVLTYAPGGISAQLNRATCLQGGPRGPKVWNPQVWGSWLEFASPCYLYATDSRIELFSAADWADVDAVEDAAPNWQQVLDERGVDLVVTARATDATLERALEQATGAWFRVYRDCDGSIWVRTTPGEPLGSTDVGCGS